MRRHAPRIGTGTPLTWECKKYLTAEFVLWFTLYALVSWALLWLTPLFIVLLAPLWLVGLSMWGVYWAK